MREILSLCSARALRYRHAKGQIREYFNKYDLSRDGCLDRDELKLFLVDLNDGFKARTATPAVVKAA